MNAAFEAAVKKALPTLVSVQVEAAPRPMGSRHGRPSALDGRGQTEPPRLGSGSGFVFSREGFILTNNHVVADAAVVTAVLSDGRRFDGVAVVGRDPDTDIAVLKIETEGLVPAELGDSESLTIGDWVLALGFPLDLSATVTAGIVSGTGRSLGILSGRPDALAPLEHFIQTDAAINPGNSGGPLADLRGRVVGVTSAIASPTGYFTGYGFAVPINIARRVADDLIRYGEVRRPRLGAFLADVDVADAEIYRLPEVSGAEVIALEPGGPAAIAGVELGDVVIAVDSGPVRHLGDLLTAIARKQPGDSIRLHALRFGRRLDLGVVLGRLQTLGSHSVPAPVHRGPARLGFDVTVNPTGSVVTEVVPYSPAFRAGIRRGQRILAINGRPIGSAEDLATAVRRLRLPGAVSLRVIDPDWGPTIINYRPEPLHQDPDRDSSRARGGGQAHWGFRIGL
ncbi:MAG: trypsin-like peptidase domain-containing protein [Gemmatimonadales bacterium]|nr:trypsin-like peptidase domain-containing protein [Gemmatimonadales bacterium]